MGNLVLCETERRATEQAELEREEWGYKGGPVLCPKRNNCSGRCQFEDLDRIIIRGAPVEHPTPTQRFYKRAQISLDLMRSAR